MDEETEGELSNALLKVRKTDLKRATIFTLQIFHLTNNIYHGLRVCMLV